MDEWWSYSPRNLLMFSARTYYRLFELHNRALWPAHLAALAAGIAILLLVRRRGVRPGPLAAALVVAAWLGVAWSYLEVRFATIHTGGRTMAIAFAVQAALLAVIGVAWNRSRLAPPAGAVRRAGLGILTYAVLIQPFVGRLLGRPWAQAEVFGLAPDPTVAATVGLLLLAPRAAWFLWPIPLAWSLFSGMTLWAMRAPEWWVLPGLALAAVALEVGKRRR